MVTLERRREISAIRRVLETWATGRREIVAVAFVGSWARGTATEGSDLDVVVLTEAVSEFLEDDCWLREVAPSGKLVHTADWGAIQERRVRLPSGLEIELGLGEPSWAGTSPVDAGTEAVVRDGLSPIYDPRGLLAGLVAACDSAGSSTDPYP